MAFGAAQGPVIRLKQLFEAGFAPDDPRFEFHAAILCDRGLIEREDRQPGYGFKRLLSGEVAWGNVALRLTAPGHDLLDAIQSPEVWGKTKEGLAKVGSWSVGLMAEIAKAYAKQLAAEKLGIHLG